MAPATVKLLVIENIMLQPAMDVYILPYCIVHYTVERKKQVRERVRVRGERGEGESWWLWNRDGVCA